jgi:hypothetical protein
VGSFNISKPYRPPRLVRGVAFNFATLYVVFGVEGNAGNCFSWMFSYSNNGTGRQQLQVHVLIPAFLTAEYGGLVNHVRQSLFTDS